MLDERASFLRTVEKLGYNAGEIGGLNETYTCPDCGKVYSEMIGHDNDGSDVRSDFLAHIMQPKQTAELPPFLVLTPFEFTYGDEQQKTAGADLDERSAIVIFPDYSRGGYKFNNCHHEIGTASLLRWFQVNCDGDDFRIVANNYPKVDMTFAKERLQSGVTEPVSDETLSMIAGGIEHEDNSHYCRDLNCWLEISHEKLTNEPSPPPVAVG